MYKSLEEMENDAAVGNHQQPPQSPPYPPTQTATLHHHLQRQHQQLQMFWYQQRQEIESVTDFKNHQLPVARIKKIMKSDEDVHMISAEPPIVFAKAREMFVLELTFRSWLHAKENKRRTLQKSDVASAIARTEIYDFLLNAVPGGVEEEIAGDSGLAVAPQPSGGGVPLCYPPAPVAAASGVYTPPSQAWQSVLQVATSAAATEDETYCSGESLRDGD